MCCFQSNSWQIIITWSVEIIVYKINKMLQQIKILSRDSSNIFNLSLAKFYKQPLLCHHCFRYGLVKFYQHKHQGTFHLVLITFFLIERFGDFTYNCSCFFFTCICSNVTLIRMFKGIVTPFCTKQSMKQIKVEIQRRNKTYKGQLVNIL